MEYTHLGSSGLKVSRVAMGTMSFGEGDSGREGWPIPYEDAVPFFRQALDLGITFWETANGYNAGTSEKAVGRALKELSRRDDIVAATKVYFPVHDGPGGRQKTGSELGAKGAGDSRVVKLVVSNGSPLRFPAGADAVTTFENRAKLLAEQADANRELSSNLAHDDA